MAGLRGAQSLDLPALPQTTGWNTRRRSSRSVSLAAGNYWLAYLPSSSNLTFVEKQRRQLRILQLWIWQHAEKLQQFAGELHWYDMVFVRHAGAGLYILFSSKRRMRRCERDNGKHRAERPEPAAPARRRTRPAAALGAGPAAAAMAAPLRPARRRRSPLRSL